MAASNEKDMPTRRRLAAAILTDGTWGLGQRKLVERYGGRFGFTGRLLVEDVLRRLEHARLIPPREGDKAFKTKARRYRGGYELDPSNPAKFRTLYPKRGDGQ